MKRSKKFFWSLRILIVLISLIFIVVGWKMDVPQIQFGSLAVCSLAITILERFERKKKKDV